MTSALPAFDAAKRAATKKKSLKLNDRQKRMIDHGIMNAKKKKKCFIQKSHVITWMTRGRCRRINAPIEVDADRCVDLLLADQVRHLALGAATHGATHVQRRGREPAALCQPQTASGWRDGMGSMETSASC
jgi:hypothetical protein